MSGVISIFIARTTKLGFIALLVSPLIGFGQDSGAAASKSYAARCAGCHGADARGSDRAPGLAGSRRLRSRSTEQLRALIKKGVPASGMPAFDLPDDELDALASLVHSLNAPAAEAPPTGNARA